VVVSYLAALAPGLPTAEFLHGTEGAIDRELNRWRPGGAAGLGAS
jgi:1-acyl-sn-glycerol-3-phosphate acyltransferase